MVKYRVVIIAEDKDYYCEGLLRGAFEYAMKIHNIKGKVVEVTPTLEVEK